jgi:hypothetical protein
MRGSSFFQSVDGDSPIRQGDIIVPYNIDESNEEKIQFGVIVTADCDIVQKKMGNFFTYVTMVTANYYLEEIWGFEELRKTKMRYRDRSTKLIYDIDKKRDPEVIPITSDALLSWLKEDGVQKVLDAVRVDQRKRNEAEQLLNVLMVAEGLQEVHGTALLQLQSCWSIMGKNRNEQRGFVQSALNQRQMRDEYVFIPSLPSYPGVGFVILLRDIRSVLVEDVYASRVKCRLAGSGNGMHRIGRFSDFLRHSISQKFGFLFSRIALTTDFESECEAAGEFISDEFAGQ